MGAAPHPASVCLYRVGAAQFPRAVGTGAFPGTGASHRAAAAAPRAAQPLARPARCPSKADFSAVFCSGGCFFPFFLPLRFFPLFSFLLFPPHFYFCRLIPTLSLGTICI